MPDSIPRLDKLIHHFTHSDDARREAIGPTPLPPHLVLLRAWQSERLARTYADLLDNPGFAPACRYFLTDIYAPRDFSQRDYDAERVHAFLSRLMPPATIEILTELIELNRLSAALDQWLVLVLEQRLGLSDSLTLEMYAEAYRLCDNRGEREHQVDLFQKLLLQVGEVAQMRGVGMMLRVAEKPVKAAGWAELFDFVARGYVAFKAMKEYRLFSSTVATRERAILNRLFDGASDPFGRV